MLHALRVRYRSVSLKTSGIADYPVDSDLPLKRGDDVSYRLPFGEVSATVEAVDIGHAFYPCDGMPIVHIMGTIDVDHLARQSMKEPSEVLEQVRDPSYTRSVIA